MRALPFDAVKGAYEQMWGQSPENFRFGAVVDQITVVDEPAAYVASHPTVPLIIGHQNDEWINDAVDFGTPDPGTIQDVANDYFPTNIGGWYPIASQNDFLQMLSLYPVPGQRKPVPVPLAVPSVDDFHEMVAFNTDYSYGCPARKLARAHDRSGSPTFRYVMTKKQPSPYFPYPAAAHMLQDFYLLDFKNGGPWDPGAPGSPEQLLSTQMTSYWANFARTGDPNGPGLPVWPRYRGDTESYIQFDTPIATGQQFHNTQCDFLDPFINSYLPIPSWVFDPSLSFQIISATYCGIPFLPRPNCSTKGYVGP
jgi:carboxylesterase type B